MIMYVSEKEKNALLEAMDFIWSNADGADNCEPYEEMCKHLKNIFLKAKKDIAKRKKKKLITDC